MSSKKRKRVGGLAVGVFDGHGKILRTVFFLKKSFPGFFWAGPIMKYCLFPDST